KIPTEDDDHDDEGSRGYDHHGDASNTKSLASSSTSSPITFPNMTSLGAHQASRGEKMPHQKPSEFKAKRPKKPPESKG
ncbi:hypothetical protein DKP78_25545, partial [Enterococcus faecium]